MFTKEFISFIKIDTLFSLKKIYFKTLRIKSRVWQLIIAQYKKRRSKRMKKTSFTVFIALLMTLAIAASCGVRSGGTNTAPSAGGEEFVPITFWFQQNGVAFTDVDRGVETDPADNWMLDFMRENSGVPFVVGDIPTYADTQTKFDLMMASGDIPDVVERAGVAILKEYGQKGAFMELSDVINNSSVFSGMYDKQQTIALEAGDGNIYVLAGVPNDFDYSSIDVRVNLFEDAGYTAVNINQEIKTPADLLEAAVKIQQKHPDVIPFGVPFSAWYSDFMPAMFNTQWSGWKWSEEDREVRHAWADGNITKVIEWCQQAMDLGVIDPEWLTIDNTTYFARVYTQGTAVVWRNNGSSRIAGPSYNIQMGNTDDIIIPMVLPTEPGSGRDKFYAFKSMLGPYGFSISRQVAGDEKKLASAVRLLEFFAGETYQEFVDWGREGKEHIVDESGIKRPTPEYSLAGEGSIKLCYNFFRINNRTAMEIGLLSSYDSVEGLSQTEKDRRVKLVEDASDKVFKEILIDKYNPTAYNDPLPEDMSNRVAQLVEECKSIIARAIIGEISMDQFETERQRIVSQNQDITDEYNRLTDITIAKFGF